MNYYDVAVLGVPLLFVVIGLVEYLKKFGVTGNWLLGSSMLIGVLLGGGYQLSAVGFPVDFAGWFGVGFYGIGLGIVASGVYDVAKNIAKE